MPKLSLGRVTVAKASASIRTEKYPSAIGIPGLELFCVLLDVDRVSLFRDNSKRNYSLPRGLYFIIRYQQIFKANRGVKNPQG